MLESRATLKDECTNIKINSLTDLQKSIIYVNWFIMKNVAMHILQLRAKSKSKVGCAERR